MPLHTSKPLFLQLDRGAVAQSPSSFAIGSPCVELFQHLLNFRQYQPVYWYCQPYWLNIVTSPYTAPTVGDVASTYRSGTHYVMLHSPPPFGTATRRLFGYAALWRFDHIIETTTAYIKWTPPEGGAANTLWESDSGSANMNTTADGRYPCLVVPLIDRPSAGYTFGWIPDASGDFVVGTLETCNCEVASLMICSLPDVDLVDDQARIWTGNVAPNQLIRGYTGTGMPSIGDLIYYIGNEVDTYNGDHVDAVSRQWLLQSGHPWCLWTDSTSYKNIRAGDDSWFAVWPRNCTLGTTTTALPALVVTTEGASEGNAAGVKFTSWRNGDTWEWTTESDVTAQLIKASDGSTSDLTLEPVDDLEYVKIEIKAPTSGEIGIHTYGLVEAAEY